MSIALPEISLLRAVLLENCGSDDAAGKHLAAACRLDVDALDYCARRFGLGDRIVWERAAAWAGLAFHETIPSSAVPIHAVVPNLDRLGEIRSVRWPVLDREVVFAAPRFDQVVRLAHVAPDRPDLRRRLCFTLPATITQALTAATSRILMDNARQRIAQRWPRASASMDVPLMARVGFVMLLGALVALAISAGALSKPLFMPLAAALLLFPGLLRLAAAFRRPVEDVAPRQLDDAELPTYSVLIPLCDEAHMVPALHRGMLALDYPPEKLDIKFVVEARSVATIAAVEALLDDPRFSLVVVPDARPRTKPKALNYALPLARGAHVVVYDAEDVPAPDQLRLAAGRFAADPGLACLQAELVPDNADEGPLAALFAGEYAGLFGRFLPALVAWGLPVPLGGTSNHFRTDVLRRIGGWDAFNVTEDADLGVRLARRRLRTATFSSRTREEAPLTLRAWMAQRTRWIKGWMRLVNGDKNLRISWLF